jgi:quinol monooxygenase YgiN
MVSFTVRLRFDHEHHEQVSEQLRALTLASRQEPGCVSYVAHFLEADSTTVLIYEQYKDDDALEFHRNRRFLPADARAPDRKPHRNLLSCVKPTSPPSFAVLVLTSSRG